MPEKLDLNNIPNHIALILDGNGRWAKKRMMPRTYGHLHGVFNIKKIVLHAQELGVKAVSLYCFSTENWRRPQEEVDYLMKLPIRYFKKFAKGLFDSDVRVIFSGRKDHFNKDLVDLINYIEKMTSNHKGIVCNVCFDYGSRDEITRAVKDIAAMYKEGTISLDDITEDFISNHLDTHGLSDCDLLIRTSGEERLSNYLLWQLAYAELYFTDVLWPDFTPEEFDKAIADYQRRNRRYGGLKEAKK